MSCRIKNQAKNTLTFRMEHLNKSAISDLFMGKKSIYELTINELASAYRARAVLGGADGYSVLLVHGLQTKVLIYNAA